MIIKDIMPSFELFQPTQLKDAFARLGRYGKGAWKMAGGYDSLSWFKERAKRPKAVIDLSGIVEMKGIRETADGIEIGARTPRARSRALKSATPAPSAAARRRTRAAGTTGRACPATGPAAPPASPTP